MKNKTSQVQNGIENLQNALQNVSSVAGQNLAVPMNITQSQDISLMINYLSDMDSVLKQLDAVVKDISTNVYKELSAKRELQSQMMQNQQQQLATTKGPTSKGANKIFNINKFSQFDMGMPSLTGDVSLDPLAEMDMDIEGDVDNLNMEDFSEELKFEDGSELKQWLDTSEPMDAIEKLTNISGNQMVSDKSDVMQDPVEIIKGGVERFYRDGTTEQEKLRIAMEIYDILPNAAKVEQPDSGSVIEAPFGPNEITSFVNNINESIKIKAKMDSLVTKKASGFNIKKFAQSKTIENVIMYGPEEKRVDPFSRQPISDWHIVERNKGFGLVVDDVWNIDWETIWRGNIMDKYSRPYRDDKGNWVGGYIQKRFEVDKWIPNENNMQLPPGKTRKEYIPGQGNMEERLETMRAEKAKERGYSPNSSGNPYNWKEASKKKVI